MTGRRADFLKRKSSEKTHPTILLQTISSESIYRKVASFSGMQAVSKLEQTNEDAGD